MRQALQSKPSGTTDVPHKALVAKRLAQCLDPALPSGVHQKALESYAYVFSTLDVGFMLCYLLHCLKINRVERWSLTRSTTLSPWIGAYLVLRIVIGEADATIAI